MSFVDAQRGRKKAPRGMLCYPDKDPGEKPWNRFTTFNQLNRNKLGITLNLRNEEGKALFKRLVACSDIVIDCFRAGLMDNLELGYDVLRTVKENIIMMSMSGFGKTGPYRDYASWGSQMECVSGQAFARGYPHSQPFMVSAYGDPINGLTGAFALLVALYHRHKTGKGQFIDFSQVEAIAPLSADFLMDYVMNGRIAGPVGNNHKYMAPHGVYRCQGDDDWIAISISKDDEWRGLLKAMGDPAWAQDEKYCDLARLWENREEIDRYLTAWTSQRDKRWLMRHLQAHGVPAGAVLEQEELFKDPHLNHRGLFEMVTHPEAGTHPHPGPTWKFSGTPLRVYRPAPCLGEHNELILGHYLGLSEQEIARLEAEQVIGKVPLDGADS